MAPSQSLQSCRASEDNEQEVRKEAVRVIEACLNLSGCLSPVGVCWCEKPYTGGHALDPTKESKQLSGKAGSGPLL